MSKYRAQPVEIDGITKLRDPLEISYVRQMTEDGYTSEQIAQRYSVSASYIRKLRKRHDIKRSEARRFWSRVRVGAPDECWEWQGCKSDGYGLFSKNEKAHRAAWRLTHHEPPAAGLVLMHSCDNRACVNPAHLSPGTHADNVADMDAKGRRNPARGERNNHNIVSEAQVKEIRRLRQEGVTYREIGEQFGLTIAGVHNITSRRSWAWLP